jgi:hypothetical protein
MNFSPNADKALDLSKKESSINDGKSEHQDLTVPSFPGIFKNVSQGFQLPSLMQPVYISNLQGAGALDLQNMADFGLAMKPS